MSVNVVQESEQSGQLPPIEVPDEDTRHVLGILQPSLGGAVNELLQRNQPGWANFLGAVYDAIDDVMRVPE